MPPLNSLTQLVNWLDLRETSNQTTDVLVDGGRGSGKSNTTHTILELWIPGFNFEDVYVYDAVDLVTHLNRNQGKKRVKTWFDEAKNLVYRRNAMTRISRAISTMMSQIRERQGTRFWVSPDSGELEDFLTKDQAQIVITCPSRGEIIVRRFWKNYHAPPGQREGRWVECFRRTRSSPVPWLGDVLPNRESAYRDFKTQGYSRVEAGLVEKILLTNRLKKPMSIGIRKPAPNGVPPSSLPVRHEEPREPRKEGGATRKKQVSRPPLHPETPTIQ